MEFRVALVGNKGCGKTTFIRRFTRTDAISLVSDTGEIAKEGDVTFALTEEDYSSIFYTSPYDAVILFVSWDRIFHEKFVAMTQATCKAKPFVICLNKSDLFEHSTSFLALENARKIMENAGMKFYLISAKTGYNVEKPLVHLLKKLAW